MSLRFSVPSLVVMRSRVTLIEVKTAKYYDASQRDLRVSISTDHRNYRP